MFPNQEELDVIIPVALELDWPTEESLIDSIRTQHKRYGFRRFALASPSGGWRSVGFPPESVFTEHARLFSRVRDALKDDGISCGWWITATLKSGHSEHLTPMVMEDGTPSPFANCPEDPSFRALFSRNVAHFAEIAHPEFIITEDDFSIHAGASQYGCFCEHHLTAFAKRKGRSYTREELVAAFRSDTPEGYALLGEWRALARDSLVKLSEEIRRAVDERTPEIPIGYMQSGGADMDGDCTAAVSRALAGKRHQPFSRFYGASYCGGDAKEIPKTLFHAIYSKQHAPDVVAYHESDTFPHTRFFQSAAFMRAMMGTVYAAGFSGSTFQTQQLLDDPNEEGAYGEMYLRERQRFRAIHKLAKLCTMRGVEIGYDPFWNTVDSYSNNPRPLWVRPVGLFGIPFVTTPARVAFWDARQARHCDDRTVMEYLAKGLILDGEAAKVLVERGYGKYLGIDVGEDVTAGMLQYDLAAREILREDVLPDLAGRHMPSAHMYAKGFNGQQLRITVTDPACRVLSDLVSFDRTMIAPVTTCFENQLGGRVAVLGITLYNEATRKENLSQSIYNYRRQRLIQSLVDWCGGEYAAVIGEPNVMLIMNEPADRENTTFRALLTLTNLGHDPLDRVRIGLPEHLKNPDQLSILDRNGTWRSIAFCKDESGIIVETSLGCCDPVYLLLQ